MVTLMTLLMWASSIVAALVITVMFLWILGQALSAIMEDVDRGDYGLAAVGLLCAALIGMAISSAYFEQQKPPTPEEVEKR